MTDRTTLVTEYLKQIFFKFWDKFWLKLGATTAIALPVTILGVDSRLFLVLFLIYMLDFLTGIIKTLALGERLTSRRAFDSIVKGAFYFCFILASWGMTIAFNDHIPLHIGAISMAIMIEFRSILENIRDSKLKIPFLSEILDYIDQKSAAFVSLFIKK